MCGCECCISSKSMHSSLLSWHENFLKNWRIKSVMYKKEGMAKCPIVYLRYIKLLTYHIKSICFRQHQKWICQKCVDIHNKNMYYHIGNVFCVVVRNFHGLIFQVHNQIGTIIMLYQSYNFMSIITYHVVLCMTDVLSMRRNSVNCVRIIHIQYLLQTFIPENSLSWWSNKLWNFINTSTFIQYRNFHFTYHI